MASPALVLVDQTGLEPASPSRRLFGKLASLRNFTGWNCPTLGLAAFRCF
jgi:hypothetical protein